MSNGQPARTKIDDLIKAERREMLRLEAEEEAVTNGGGAPEEGGDDMVEDGDSTSESESDSEESGSSDDSEDGESDSDDSEHEDKMDDDHSNIGLEEDNLRNTLAEGENDEKLPTKASTADEGDNSDSSDAASSDSDDSDSDEDSSSDTPSPPLIDSAEAEERAKEAAFFADDEETPKADSEQQILFSQLNLSRPIMRGVAAIGFVTPTPIQAMCIPPALAGRDLCASAVTGSGKTAAFLLPILQRLINRPRNPSASRALVLTPTRELAAQCLSMMVSICRFTELNAVLIVGGSKNSQAQAAELRSRPDVIIATPGRLLDHVTNAMNFDLEDIEVLVLDEADRLLEMGFVEEVSEIVRACPKERQTLLFSATFGTSVDDLVSLSMKKPIRINVGRASAGSKNEVEIAPRLEQEFVRIRSGNEDNREAILLSLLTRTFKERVMVFFDTKVVAHKMMIICGLCGIRCGELHGDLTQTQRLEALESFKSGEIEVLLCTDLAARGLDINSVQCVLNFEMPNHVETYVHRVGRTARAGCGGKSCTLISEGRRHLMKDVVKDAEEKNKGKKGGKKSTAAVIRSRTVPAAVISHFNKKIAKLQTHLEDILAAEQVARLDRIADMEATKVANILTHEKEIKARPRKDWFQSAEEKKALKDEGVEKVAEIKKEITKMGNGGDHNLSRKKKRRMEMRKEQDSMIEERKREERENGNVGKKVTTEDNMKINARVEKLKANAKRDKDNLDYKSVHDEEKEHAKNMTRKIRKPKTEAGLGSAGGLFDEEIVIHSKKRNIDADKRVGGKKFIEVAKEHQGKLRKGGKLSNNKFKSKAKHNRRK